MCRVFFGFFFSLPWSDVHTVPWLMTTTCWNGVFTLLFLFFFFFFTCSASLLKRELRWVKQSLWDAAPAAGSSVGVRGRLSFDCDWGAEVCAEHRTASVESSSRLDGIWVENVKNLRWNARARRRANVPRTDRRQEVSPHGFAVASGDGASLRLPGLKVCSDITDLSARRK